MESNPSKQDSNNTKYRDIAENPKFTNDFYKMYSWLNVPKFTEALYDGYSWLEKNILKLNADGVWEFIKRLTKILTVLVVGITITLVAACVFYWLASWILSFPIVNTILATLIGICTAGFSIYSNHKKEIHKFFQICFGNHNHSLKIGNKIN